VNAKTKIGIGIAAGALVLSAGGIGIAYAVSGDGAAVSGSTADHARAAAATAVPGGKADTVQSETDEGNAAYGVTVTKPDGTQVTVHLDKNFTVVDTQPVSQQRDGDDG